MSSASTSNLLSSTQPRIQSPLRSKGSMARLLGVRRPSMEAQTSASRTTVAASTALDASPVASSVSTGSQGANIGDTVSTPRSAKSVKVAPAAPSLRPNAAYRDISRRSSSSSELWGSPLDDEAVALGLVAPPNEAVPSFRAMQTVQQPIEVAHPSVKASAPRQSGPQAAAPMTSIVQLKPPSSKTLKKLIKSSAGLKRLMAEQERPSSDNTHSRLHVPRPQYNQGPSEGRKSFDGLWSGDVSPTTYHASVGRSTEARHGNHNRLPSAPPLAGSPRSRTFQSRKPSGLPMQAVGLGDEITERENREAAAYFVEAERKRALMEAQRSAVTVSFAPQLQEHQHQEHQAAAMQHPYGTFDGRRSLELLSLSPGTKSNLRQLRGLDTYLAHGPVDARHDAYDSTSPTTTPSDELPGWTGYAHYVRPSSDGEGMDPLFMRAGPTQAVQGTQQGIKNVKPLWSNGHDDVSQVDLIEQSSSNHGHSKSSSHGASAGCSSVSCSEPRTLEGDAPTREWYFAGSHASSSVRPGGSDSPSRYRSPSSSSCALPPATPPPRTPLPPTPPRQERTLPGSDAGSGLDSSPVQIDKGSRSSRRGVRKSRSVGMKKLPSLGTLSHASKWPSPPERVSSILGKEEGSSHGSGIVNIDRGLPVYPEAIKEEEAHSEIKGEKHFQQASSQGKEVRPNCRKADGPGAHARTSSHTWDEETENIVTNFLLLSSRKRSGSSLLSPLCEE